MMSNVSSIAYDYKDRIDYYINFITFIKSVIPDINNDIINNYMNKENNSPLLLIKKVTLRISQNVPLNFIYFIFPIAS
jgi:hypothetical protein